MKVIAFCNQKGGVGKTTTAVNLGSALQLLGKKVLLIDLDPQANLSSYLGFEKDNKPTISEVLASEVSGMNVPLDAVIRHNEPNNLDFIPSNINLANAETILIQAISREMVLSRRLNDITSKDVIEEYDYIFIDCNPSLGVLVSNALAASDGLIIPVQTQKFALDGLDTLTSIYEKIKSACNQKLELVGVLPTMVDSTNMSRNIIAKLEERYPEKVFKTTISRSVEAANSSENMLCLTMGKHKLGNEYKELAKEFLERI